MLVPAWKLGAAAHDGKRSSNQVPSALCLVAAHQASNAWKQSDPS